MNDDTLYVAPEDDRTDYVRDPFQIIKLMFDQVTIPTSLNHQWLIGIVVS